MISVNDLRPGTTFQFENNIYVVLEASHSKQGRGQANVKVKAKDIVIINLPNKVVYMLSK